MRVCSCCKAVKLPLEYSSWMSLCEDCFLLEEGVTYQNYYKWLYSKVPWSSAPTRGIPKEHYLDCKRTVSKVTKSSKKSLKATTPYRVYREQVKILTESTKSLIMDIELRSYYTYHIDHKISASAGFILGITPEDISHLSNLRIISALDNKVKGMRSHIDYLNRWILDKYELSETSFTLTPNDLKKANKAATV